MPFREVLYRCGRNEEGRLGYHLVAIKPITWGDADDYDDTDDPGLSTGGQSNIYTAVVRLSCCMLGRCVICWSMVQCQYWWPGLLSLHGACDSRISCV